MTPIAVLADRSREASRHPTLPELQPEATFLVTDNHRRLTGKLLRAYDVVAACGHGAVPYSPAEVRAVRDFVRRGGSLVLAASAGEFEASTERPASDLAVNGLARAFGFSFLSARNLPPDEGNIRRYRKRRLQLTAAGRQIGPTFAETMLWYPAPLSVPPGAVVLLRERATGTPVFARARIGRGRVLVCGDLAIWSNGWSPFLASLYLAHVAPRRRAAAARPEAVRDVPREFHREAPFVIRSTPSTREDVSRVLDLARRVRREFQRELRPPGKAPRIEIRLEAGDGMRPVWGSGKDAVLFLGASRSDAGVVEAVTRAITWRHLFAWWGGGRHWPFVNAAERFLKIRVLERLGFEKQARAWRRAAAGGRRIDLGREYSHQEPSRASVRFFLDTEAWFGRGTFRRMCRALPREKPFAAFPESICSALDGYAHYLSRTSGPHVFDRLEREGHTLRRIPGEALDPEKLEAGIRRAIVRRLEDRTLPAYERLAAARTLSMPLGKDKPEVRTLAKKSRGPRVGDALPAALSLARVRDERGAEALRRWARSEDPGLASVATLLLVAEAGDRTAARRLPRLARRQGTRFQLACGRALSAIHDPRAEEFSFHELPGCRFSRVENGNLRIYAIIDGRKAGVVRAGPMWWVEGYGRASSQYYVYWVHTCGHHRRLGLARSALGPALRHRLGRACSATALHAMSDYVAHVLYRDLGLIDSRVFRAFEKPPEKRRRRAPTGIRVRPARNEDVEAVGALLRAVHGPRPHPTTPLGGWIEGRVARVAVRGDEIVGAVGIQVRTPNAEVCELAVADGFEDLKNARGKVLRTGSDIREAVGLALLSSAEAHLAGTGIVAVRAYTWWPYDDAFHQRLLQRAGYGSKPEALVEQRRINDLPRFLGEIREVLRRRLREGRRFAGWRGTVTLAGGRLKASLRIDRGRVRVLGRSPKKASLLLSGDEEAIQRIVLGASNPFEEQTQTRIEIQPPLTSESRTLLQTLFPCVLPPRA